MPHNLKYKFLKKNTTFLWNDLENTCELTPPPPHPSQVIATCICLSLSAYVTLALQFFPKLYIILFKPNQNDRRYNASNGSANTIECWLYYLTVTLGRDFAWRGCLYIIAQMARLWKHSPKAPLALANGRSSLLHIFQLCSKISIS